MRILKDFIAFHSQEDLMILGFFLTVGATVAGWVLDTALQKRGFGVIGNGALIFFGAVVGAVVAQMNGPILHVSETNRILLFSASSSGLVLVLFCLVKSRIAVT